MLKVKSEFKTSIWLLIKENVIFNQTIKLFEERKIEILWLTIQEAKNRIYGPCQGGHVQCTSRPYVEINFANILQASFGHLRVTDNFLVNFYI